MVFLEHRPRVFYSLIYYSNRSHGTVCTTTCKGCNYCRSIPRDPASWGKMAAIPDDCERTATVALPTAASSGFISGEVGISAALDAFSTVYELPLMRFKNGQTDRQTDGRARSLYLALRCASREVKMRPSGWFMQVRSQLYKPKSM